MAPGILTGRITTMKIILLQDVDHVGKKYEIVEVKDGHARNLLIPKKMAKAATKQNLKWLESRREEIDKEIAEDLKKAQELASRIDGQEVQMTVKVGEAGQLFEAVNAQKIADRIKEMGFEIKKSQVVLKDSIKELGEFPVKLNLAHNLEADIKVIVAAEDIGAKDVL